MWGAGTTARLGLTGCDDRVRRERLASSLALLLAVAGCGGGDDPAAAPTPTPSTGSPAPSASSSASSPAAAAPRVYVAVGASETAGVGADHPATQAWPRVLRDDRALPGTRLVNLGVPGATVQDGLTEQLPRALAADPDVVTVWLAVNDVLNLVPVTEYDATAHAWCTPCGAAAARGPRGQRSAAGPAPGVPDLPARARRCPGSPACCPLVPTPRQVRALVAEYNAAIARVVAAEGAVAVDLSGNPGRSVSALTADDGFHPSTRGHRVVAAAFARALRTG